MRGGAGSGGGRTMLTRSITMGANWVSEGFQSKMVHRTGHLGSCAQAAAGGGGVRVRAGGRVGA